MTREAATSNPAPETLGQRLRRLMQAGGTSQTALAAKAGIDRSDLNRIINDRRAARPQELALIAQTMGLSVDELVEGVLLTDEQRKAVHFFEQSVRRVLLAEAERDETRARLRAADDALATGREEWRADREELLAQIERVRTEGQVAADALRHAVAQSEQARRAERMAGAEQISALKAELDVLRASEQEHRRQNLLLYAELVRERSDKYATGFIAGLAGFVGGAVITNVE